MTIGRKGNRIGRGNGESLMRATARNLPRAASERHGPAGQAGRG
jgi:hypothetical protein